MINSQSPKKRLVYVCFFTVSVLLILLSFYYLRRSDEKISGKLTPITEGWKEQNGRVCSIDDIRTNSNGTPVILDKKLIQGFSSSDCLCFSSHDVDVDVFLDDSRIYSFECSPNITGMGYGTAFHEVDLPKDLGGRILRLEFRAPDQAFGYSYGYITDIYIGSAMSYVHTLIDRKILSAILSVFIVFFGIILILIRFAVNKRESLPIDILSLGMASVLIGLWLFMATDIIQLVTDSLYTVRVLDRITILLVGYPFIRFLNSLTNKKRFIYPLIMISFTLLTVAILFILRFAASVDMLFSFLPAFIVYSVLIIILCIVMMVDDEMQCRVSGTHSRLRGYYAGLLFFLLCIVADIILYTTRHMVGNDIYGVATRTGALILVAAILRQFISWWTRDRAVIERGRLISNALSVATSESDPDECIKRVLEQTAVRFGAKRAVVFEDQLNGKYHGTYVWFDPALSSRPADTLYLYQKSFVEEIERLYNANGGRFVIDDIENYTNINANVYNLLKGQKVQSIVFVPFGRGAVTSGLLAFVDLAPELLEEAAENAPLIAYFLSELILQRDEEKRTRIFYYNDPFSGALNRRAFNEFAADNLDNSSPFGLAVIEVTDLETVSAQKGYEVGDKLVSDSVSVMSDVFGRDNVYRLVGSRFAAFGFESDEAYFEDDAQRLVKEARARNINLSVGCAFCNNGTNDINTVLKYAISNLH